MENLPEPPRAVDTQTLVAEAFGVKPATVTRWKKQGCAALENAPFELAAVRDWLTERESKNPGKRGRPFRDPDPEVAATSTDLRQQKLRWDARKAELDARIKAVQVKILEESYYSKQMVEEMFGERCAVLAQALELFPDAVSHDACALVRDGQISRAELVDLLRRRMDDLRAAFADENFLELLEQRRKRAESGAKIGRGSGRPKGS